MSDIAADLGRILADLKRSAPGLTHIHAQIERIASELGHSADTDHGHVPVSAPVRAYNPEFAAGVIVPTNARRILEAEEGKPDDDEVDEDLAGDDYNGEDEPGDAEDAA